MNVVVAAVGSVLPKLLQLLQDEYKLQRGVKKDVESLSMELKVIHTFLCKVSDVPWRDLDCQVKEWASEVRETAYNMEDILDKFLVRVECREPIGQSRVELAINKVTDVLRNWKTRHYIGSAIKHIKDHVQEVANRHARYRIDDLAMNSASKMTTRDPRLAAMYKEVASLVGIEKPSNDIIQKLSSHQEENIVVSIFGTGGIGKTTLAKSVYDKLRHGFKWIAFVPVGMNPNRPKVLMDILYELDKTTFADIHTSNRDERHLIDSLRDFLLDKRYFIVIDDIWGTTFWEETVSLALVKNNCGSKIIITTRNSQVAQKLGDEVYRMQPLSYHNSKTLFYTRIFGTKEKWPDNEPDEITHKFLKKCDGVPLAIITMASLLVGTPREIWSNMYTAIGFGNKDDEQVENTMRILSFSYYDMPDYLRTCLLYVSVFPEDYKIDKDFLIWRWIAEGFIQEKPGIRLFDLGEQYFNDLVNRSMVQAVESQSDGMVEGCRVHDMVLDLIRSISYEQNFVSILDNDDGTVSSTPKSARRLALHKNIMDHTTHGNKVDMLKVRSFFANSCAFGNWDPISNCKILRVLDLEDCTNMGPSHLVHLGNLHHLRYLGLKGCTQIDDLPSEIGDLKFMKVLNMENTKIIQLPLSISRLTQLVCLKGNMLGPNWIGKLTSLEELQVALYCSNDGEEDHIRGFLKEVGRLRELRVFRCQVHAIDDCMQKDLVSSICNMHKLQILEFPVLRCIVADTTVWGQEDFVFSQQLRVLYLSPFYFSCLPARIGAAYLPNLTHLSICLGHMDAKDLAFIIMLPELIFLFLSMNATVTVSNISAGNGYFQKLRFFNITSMIQFQYDEGNSSVSIHTWNGIDVMPFKSSKKSCTSASYAVMPNLEEFRCSIPVRGLKDNKIECGNIIGLEYLPSLQRAMFDIRCAGASANEVNEAVTALRKATMAHSNRPTFRVFKDNKHQDNPSHMISAAQDPKDRKQKARGVPAGQ